MTLGEEKKKIKLTTDYKIFYPIIVWCFPHSFLFSHITGSHAKLPDLYCKIKTNT